MKRINNFLILSALAASLFASGCYGAYYVTARPAEPYYVRPAAPFYGAVWIPGEWVWNGRGYAYISGHWVQPRPGRIYVAGHWNQGPRGYVWIKGYWR
jgi:hypothetical protein